MIKLSHYSIEKYEDVAELKTHKNDVLFFCASSWL